MDVFVCRYALYAWYFLGLSGYLQICSKFAIINYMSYASSTLMTVETGIGFVLCGVFALFFFIFIIYAFTGKPQNYGV